MMERGRQRSMKFYERMASLHGQLKTYEEDQRTLEDEFGRLWSQLPISGFSGGGDESNSNFSKPVESRGRRNEAILAKIQELETNSALFAARADRLRVMRTEYESLLRRYIPRQPVYSPEIFGQSYEEKAEERKFPLFPSIPFSGSRNVIERATTISTGVNTDISGSILPAPENECKNEAGPINSFPNSNKLFPSTHNTGIKGIGSIYPDFPDFSSASETTTETTSAAEEMSGAEDGKKDKNFDDTFTSDTTSMSRLNNTKKKLFESDDSSMTTTATKPGKKPGMKNSNKGDKFEKSVLFSESEATFEEEDEEDEMSSMATQKTPEFLPRDESENEEEEPTAAEVVMISTKEKEKMERTEMVEVKEEGEGGDKDIEGKVMINEEEGESQPGKEDPSKISPSRTPPEFLDGNEAQMILATGTTSHIQKEPSDGDSQMDEDNKGDAAEDVREEKGDEDEKEKENPSRPTDLITEKKSTGKKLKLKLDYEDSESSEVSEKLGQRTPGDTQDKPSKDKEDLDDFFDD